MKKIIECNEHEAKKFFLQEESYINFDLPQYFNFKNLLTDIDSVLSKKNFNISGVKDPSNFENVNYKIYSNKDGKYAWRQYQIIHPVLYVRLVNLITQEENWKKIKETFSRFSEQKNIKCFSIPIISESKQSNKASMVTQWWEEIEQQSIKLALNYEYMLHTDIVSCYNSIYTHTIAWAIHGKDVAKRNKNNKSLFGNLIDKHLRMMANGQTNGIPQGSSLMDLIAEIIIGYSDFLLSEKLKYLNLNDYEILRFRDDYRIFSNSVETLEKIAKALTEVLMNLGLSLNTNKTLISANIIKDAIKPDKYYRISHSKKNNNILEQLYIIYDLSEKFPNSGTVNKELTEFFKRIENLKKLKYDPVVLISLVTHIMGKSPRTYAISSALISKFISFIHDDKTIHEIISLILDRFNKLPNTGLLQIWLQRILIKKDYFKDYEGKFDEVLCQKVFYELTKHKIRDYNNIWNSSWLTNDLKELKELVDNYAVVDVDTIHKMNPLITRNEVELFKVFYDDSIYKKSL